MISAEDSGETSLETEMFSQLGIPQEHFFFSGGELFGYFGNSLRIFFSGGEYFSYFGLFWGPLALLGPWLVLNGGGRW